MRWEVTPRGHFRGVKSWSKFWRNFEVFWTIGADPGHSSVLRGSSRLHLEVVLCSISSTFAQKLVQKLQVAYSSQNPKIMILGQKWRFLAKIMVFG